MPSTLSSKGLQFLFFIFGGQGCYVWFFSPGNYSKISCGLGLNLTAVASTQKVPCREALPFNASGKAHHQMGFTWNQHSGVLGVSWKKSEPAELTQRWWSMTSAWMLTEQWLGGLRRCGQLGPLSSLNHTPNIAICSHTGTKGREMVAAWERVGELPK